MTFLLLLKLTLEQQPVVLVPPFYGTNLWTTYNQTNLPWFCPQEENDTLLWVGPKFLLPHRVSCFFNLMTTFLDENGKITDWPNTTVSIHDFGGDESTRFAAHLKTFNISAVVTYARIVDTFKERGWTLKKDLFIAPYDWRVAPTYSEGFFEQLKGLIERAYADNGNEKVVLFGFSLGGFLSQQFMSKYVSQQWKNKYIKQAILMAPSFTGTTDNLHNFWIKRTPLMPLIKMDALDLVLESWPVCHVHMPNEFIFANETIIYGPNGEEYKAPDVYNLIMNHHVVRNEFLTMYEKSEKILREEPKDLGVPTTILYNTAVPTTTKLNFTKGWNKKPKKIKGRGDGAILGDGLDWACRYWKQTRCFDFRNPSKEFHHQPLISNQYVLDVITNITNDYNSFHTMIEKNPSDKGIVYEEL